MLRVTIDLLPFGDESAKRTLATYEIVNRGPLDGYGEECTLYSVVYDGPKGKIESGFTHDRADGVDACVRAAMAAIP